MSDDSIFTRFYSTTDSMSDTRRTGGCGHLHPVPERAVSCAAGTGTVPVVVARDGKQILREDPALASAKAAAADARHIVKRLRRRRGAA